MYATRDLATSRRASRTTTTACAWPPDETVETQLWLDEHEWLYTVLKSADNVSPTFRFPDLISACVSLMFADRGAAERIFDYLGRSLVLRDPRTPRRREYIWREQYEQLRALQLSVANRHPNPMFQLDQLTTACVALVCCGERPAERLLEQARRNTAARTARSRESRAVGPT